MLDSYLDHIHCEKEQTAPPPLFDQIFNVYYHFRYIHLLNMQSSRSCFLLQHYSNHIS